MLESEVASRAMAKACDLERDGWAQWELSVARAKPTIAAAPGVVRMMRVDRIYEAAA
jgi:hypothetical protein